MTEVTQRNIGKIIQKEIKELTEENREATIIRLKEYLIRFFSTSVSNNFLFVYGTLRKGQYNYSKLKALFGEDSIESLYETESTYCGLYDLGQYPVMIESKGSLTTQGEVIYCNDEVYKAIKDMEEGAGYVSKDTHLWLRGFSGEKSWDLISMTTYVAGKELEEQVNKNPKKYSRIFSGDWCKYIKSVEVEDTRTTDEMIRDYYQTYECY